MPYIHEACPQCGAPTDVHVGQIHSYLNRLEWHKSYDCTACGLRLEVDGGDDTPEEIRQAVLAVYGPWELVVDETDRRATQAVSILRAALKLSLADAVRLRKGIPGAVVTGTRGEMEWLQALLSRKGLIAQSREQS